MEWDELYELYLNHEYEKVKKEYLFSKSYGPSNEILEVAEILEKEAHRIALINSAIRHGTVYQPEDYKKLSELLNDQKLVDYLFMSSEFDYKKEDMPLVEGYVSDEAIQYIAYKKGFEYFEENPFAKYVEPPKDVVDYNVDGYHPENRNSGGGILKGIFAGAAMLGGVFLGVIFHSANEINKPRVCNGDCTHCPPHFGYRYGRWYYGHDHAGGCEFGGNRGSGRMD